MSYKQRSYTRVLAITGAAVVLALHIISCTGPEESNDAPLQPSVAETSIQTNDTQVTQYPTHESNWKEMQLGISEDTCLTSAYIAEEPHEDDTTKEPLETNTIEEPLETNTIEESHEEDTTEEPLVFTLTDVEDLLANYDLLKRVIVSEAGNQGMQGMCAVAQVIYDRTYCSKHDWNQDEGLYGVLTMRNQFARPYPWDLDDFEPTVSEAIDAVFIHGDRVFDEVVTYFYNPVGSTEAGIKFMQSQKYVGTIRDHEFRTGWDEND